MVTGSGAGGERVRQQEG